MEKYGLTKKLRYLTKNISYTITKIFSLRGAKVRLITLSLVSSIIALSELGIAKVFTDIVVNVNASKNFPVIELGVFLILSVSARLAHYLQRTKRVVFLDQLIMDSKVKNPGNSWNLSLAIEVTNIFSYGLQIITVSTFLLYLNWKLGLFTLVGIFVTLAYFNKIAADQDTFQKEIFRAKYRKIELPSVKKVLGRVKGGEIGTFISAISAISAMTFLILLHRLGWILTANAIVAFFALRMLSTNLGSLSSSLVRFVRALINSSISTVAVTHNSPEDETF